MSEICLVNAKVGPILCEKTQCVRRWVLRLMAGAGKGAVAAAGVAGAAAAH
jgi:hypothetical protein